MREGAVRPEPIDRLSPLDVARLAWLVTAERLVAARTQVATVQYEDPDRVEANLDMLLFPIEMPVIP